MRLHKCVAEGGIEKGTGASLGWAEEVKFLHGRPWRMRWEEGALPGGLGNHEHGDGLARTEIWSPIQRREHQVGKRWGS